MIRSGCRSCDGRGERVAGGVVGVSDRVSTSGVGGGVAEGEGEGEGGVASGGVEVPEAAAG